ncbi:hypothetical protein BHE74_00010048 [Ensete ventricosum]|nr:hypothetical protein BHE74_00010048 [Ensete ventricosum]
MTLVSPYGRHVVQGPTRPEVVGTGAEGPFGQSSFRGEESVARWPKGPADGTHDSDERQWCAASRGKAMPRHASTGFDPAVRRMAALVEDLRP